MNDLENFDPDWLALREPLDHATRSARLEELLVPALADRPALRIVDLGAGSGSTLRHLAPRLAELGVDAEQHWLLVDHDEELLQRALATPAPAATSVRTARADLGDPDALRSVLTGADLVVGSALLDVLSAAVADTLLDGLSALAPRPAVLFVLTVTGGATTEPPPPRLPPVSTQTSARTVSAPTRSSSAWQVSPPGGGPSSGNRPPGGWRTRPCCRSGRGGGSVPPGSRRRP